MKINKISKETEEKVKQILAGENKEQAICDAVELIVAARNEELIQQIIAESEQAQANAEYRSTLGLRTLSEEEKGFYESIKDVKQAITAGQLDIIPSEIIDRTLDDVKTASKLLNLVTFAPASVKKWITAAKTVAAVW